MHYIYIIGVAIVDGARHGGAFLTGTSVARAGNGGGGTLHENRRGAVFAAAVLVGDIVERALLRASQREFHRGLAYAVLRASEAERLVLVAKAAVDAARNVH